MSSNYSLYAIPAVYSLVILPIMLAHRLVSHKVDLLAPRSLLQNVKDDQAIPQAIKTEAIRLRGAAENGFENFSLVVAAVIVGNMGGVDVAVLNGLSAVYVASRLVYVVLYWKGYGVARSVCFWSGVGVLWTIFGLGAGGFRKGEGVGL